MNLAISNLAWKPAEDDAVAELLRKYEFGGIELAPTKLWPDLTRVSQSEVADYRRFWNDRGLRIVAMQALLFGRDELTIFDSQAQRDAGIEYFRTVFQIAQWLGARALIYGSPRNRRGIDGQDPDNWTIAADYFRTLGALATTYGVCLCIEPLPKSYPCDFILDAAEGRRLVEMVGEPGFGLHLDASSLWMAEEDLDQVLASNGGSIQHFHASEPKLAPVHAGGPVPVPTYLRQLAKHGYANWVSIEMLEGDPSGSNTGHVEAGLAYLREAVG